MNSKYQIRPLSQSDIGTRLWLLLSQLTHAPPIPVNDIKKYIQNKNHFSVVTIYQGQLVGHAKIILEDKLIHGGKKVGHIEDVVVDCEHRNLGLAKNMLEILVEYAKIKNCYKIILNTTLPGVYQKCGFHPTNQMQMRMNI